MTLVSFNFFCALAEGSARIVITGSSTVAPLVSEIAKRFESKNPNIRVDVQTGGSSRGISDVLSGVAHIGMVSRSLKVEETKKLKNYVLAKDGIGLILHSSNPVTKLTDEEIVKIYNGRIENWRDVGGLDRPITVINKADGRSTLELFLSHFKLKSSDIRPHVVIGDNEQGIKTASGNSNSIGYVSIGAAEYSIKNDVKIKLLPMGAVEATVENIRNGSFSLSRSLNLITKGVAEGTLKEFIEFATSREVHDLVEKQYFVPVEL